MSNELAVEYLPERNAPLGGTIEFADGDYQFPLNLPVDKLADVLGDQAAEYGDEIGGSTMPHIRIRRDDAVYDVGYRPDLECGERHASFIAKRDQYGDDMVAYQDLEEVVEQAGLGQYTAQSQDGKGT